MLDLTPMLPVADKAKSIAFFEETLGFETRVDIDNYAYLRRDDVALRLIEADDGFDPKAENRQVHCYIDVDDVDALYAELKPALDRLPAGRVRAPFDTDYGMRELHVKDEDALLISFGQERA